MMHEIVKEGDMRVPGKVVASDSLFEAMDDGVKQQLRNVATMPGIVQASLCMPDAHYGYGFPIGGVAAFDIDNGGVISPGGIGFDINCGMRLLTTKLHIDQIEKHLPEIVKRLFKAVPTGVGCKGTVKLDIDTFKDICERGAAWCVDNGYATTRDIEYIEDNGCLQDADATFVSEKAILRGLNQLGTLGSGNHYCEIQVVRNENVRDWDTAKRMGIEFDGQVVIMIHCGSRGFGHQIASEYLREFLDKMPEFGIEVPDKELACAPFNSDIGQAYYKAMCCAANMAFANRQVISHNVAKIFKDYFHLSDDMLGMQLVYDVAHNIAKVETHKVDGEEKRLLVHRKGSTRAFGPGRSPELPAAYDGMGQPVILGGSMETGSYLLVGTDKAGTFASSAHGAGRAMSRLEAKEKYDGKTLLADMKKRGIHVQSASMKGLAEEAGGAYKDINEVVQSLEEAGLCRPIVQLLPVGNIKG